MDSPLYNVVTELQQLPLDQVLLRQQSLTANFGVCCMNVSGGGNIGMIVRSACLMGAKEMIICGRKKYDKRFTVGADHYQSITYWDDVLDVSIDHIKRATIKYHAAEFVQRLKASNWNPVFVEQGGVDIRHCNILLQFPNNLYIMGNESGGIPVDFITAVSDLMPTPISLPRAISLPQWSVMRSMNVSIAAGIVMWEARNALENSPTCQKNENSTLPIIITLPPPMIGQLDTREHIHGHIAF